MKPLKTTALLFSAALLLTVGCRKTEKNTNSEDETAYAVEYAQMERNFNEVQDLADRAQEPGSMSGFKMASSCLTVTNDTASVPHILTLDFGTSNCLCADGRYRRGKIIVHYTGHYKQPGAVRNYSFDQYFVNDNQLLGSKTVTNMGLNSSGQDYYQISVNGSLVLANGNGTRSWTSTRTRTWTAGYDTPTWTDDAYDIDGTATITRANGHTFDVDITTPLHRALSCGWIESGVVNIQPENGALRTLDFGNSGCDDQATITVNGTTYNIQLP